MSAAIFILLNLIDILTSVIFVKFGLGSEVGVLTSVFNSWSWIGLSAVKMALAVVVSVALIRMKRHDILNLLSLCLSILCIYTLVGIAFFS